MKAQEIIAIRLDRSIIPGTACLSGYGLQELFECLVKAAAQEAEELAVVLDGSPAVST